MSKSKRSSWLWLIALVPMMVAAESSIPRGYDVGPVRVLRLDKVEGSVGIRRESQTTPSEAGVTLVDGDSLTVAPDSRAELGLGRFGKLEFVPAGGYASLSVEQLPFSSWAADLSTRLRMDGAALRVSWRPTANTQWPLTIAIGQWLVDLGAGEFLLRGDPRRAQVCTLSGWLELRDEPRGFRKELRPGQCFLLREDDLPEAEGLIAQTWSPWWPEASIVVGEPAAPPVSQRKSLRAEPVIRTLEPSVPETSSSPGARVDSTSPIQAAAESSGNREPQDLAQVPSSPDVIMPPKGLDPSTVREKISVQAKPGVETRRPEAAPPTPSVSEPVVVEEPIGVLVAPARPALEVEDAEAGVGAEGESAGALHEGPEWIVNVMTVSNREVALAAMEQLREAGHDAALRSETVRGRSSYRVIVPGIPSEQEAFRTVSRLQTRLGFRGAWALQKR